MFKVFLLFFLLNFVSCACPNGTVEYQSSCYSFNSAPEGFAAAELLCSQAGGHLVSIHDAFVNAIISQTAPNYFNINSTYFWIGATKMLSQGNWSWTDNTTFDFTDWKQNEPQNNSYCVTVSMTDGTWKVEDCYIQHAYVCKIYPETKPCPDFPTVWYYFAPTNSCYRYLYKLYNDALKIDQDCQSFGAHAPSIHSAEEFKFVMNLTGMNSVFTGIYGTDGVWYTTDGSAADFLQVTGFGSCFGSEDGNRVTMEYYEQQGYIYCRAPVTMLMEHVKSLPLPNKYI